jgi:hypothetical protein
VADPPVVIEDNVLEQPEHQRRRLFEPRSFPGAPVAT